jgi:hypothetical protein
VSVSLPRTCAGRVRHVQVRGSSAGKVTVFPPGRRMRRTPPVEIRQPPVALVRRRRKFWTAARRKRCAAGENFERRSAVQWNQPVTDQKVDSIIFKTAHQFFVYVSSNCRLRLRYLTQFGRKFGRQCVSWRLLVPTGAYRCPRTCVRH